MNADAKIVVGGVLAATAFLLMIAIIWFRWKFWGDRP